MIQETMVIVGANCIQDLLFHWTSERASDSIRSILWSFPHFSLSLQTVDLPNSGLVSQIGPLRKGYG